MDLKKATLEELQKEIDARKLILSLPRPNLITPISDKDLSDLCDLTEECVNELDTENIWDASNTTFIFAKVMLVLYGSDFFKWFNSKRTSKV